MKKIFSHIRAWFFPIVLLLLSAYAFFYHYQPGQYLMGWDTLHPELNFSLNFSRLFNGVWRFDQGLGAVAAHAHMADLPRVAALFVMDLFLPQHLLRATYIYLCLLFGLWGVYYLTNRWLKSRGLAFLAAIFYLLNLATVQHFYVVFDMFAVQYAALPWLFYLLWQYLKRGKRAILWRFALVTLLATPMAYAFTLAYAYFLALIVFCLIACLMIRKRQFWQRAGQLVLLTFLVNSFWFLPNLYFILDSAWQVPLAKTNRLFSPEAYLHNFKYGQLQDALIFKNFLFDWSDYRFDSQTFQALLGAWDKQLAKPLLAKLIYLPSLLSLLAFPLHWLKPRKASPGSKQWFFWGILGVTGLNLLLLLPATYPLNHLFDALRQLSSVFDEGLRFPFTKFSIIFLFGMSLLFASTLQSLAIFMQRMAKRAAQFWQKIGFALILGLFVWLYWPVFQGELVSSRLWLDLPNEYQQLFDYMDEQPNDGRIALLPAASFWNWEYTDWGFQGAGFLWFGLKQPLMTRDADRWNLHNAQFYRELSTAIFAEDYQALELLCEKYQVKWLLLDQHLIAPEYGDASLGLGSIQKVLASSNKFVFKAGFGDQLLLYQFEDGTDHHGYLFSPHILTALNNDFFVANQDQIYADLGNYFYDQKGPEYPFYKWWQVDESLDFLSFDWSEQVLSIRAPQEQPEAVKQSVSSRDLLLSVIFEKNNDGPIIKSEFLKPEQLLELNDLIKQSRYLLIDQKKLIDLSALTSQTVYLSVASRWQFLSDFSRQLVPTLADIDWQVDFCQGNHPDGFLNFIIQADHLLISAQANDVCLSAPLSGFIRPVEQPALLSFFENGMARQELLIADKDWSLRFSPDVNDLEKIWQLNNWQIQTGAKLIDDVLVEQEFSGFSWTNQELLWPLEGEAKSFAELPNTEACGEKPAEFEKRSLVGGILSLESRDGAICDYLNFPALDHAQSHLLIVESRHVSGLPQRLCLSNSSTGRCDLYTQLHDGNEWQTQYFLIPGTVNEGQGYEAHFQNLAIGQLQTSNELGRVGLYVFPEQLFAAWQLSEGNEAPSRNELKIEGLKSFRNWFYQIKATGGGYLALNNSHNQGWIAISQGKVLEHLKLNNWANLWLLSAQDGETSVVWLIFWPQLLEYLGLVMLIVGLIIYRPYFSRDFSTKE